MNRKLTLAVSLVFAAALAGCPLLTGGGPEGYDIVEQPGEFVYVPRADRPEPPPPLDLDDLPARDLPLEAPPVAAITEGERRPEAAALVRAADALFALGARVDYPRFGPGVGWTGTMLPDGSGGTGEAGQSLPPDVILLQRCTCRAGTALLSAYRATGEPRFLEYAGQVGNLLLAGQSPYGGWFYELWLGPEFARSIHVWPGQEAWTDQRAARGDDYATFDDTSTTAEAEFLYQLWWVSRDQRYYEGWYRAMEFIILTQRERGDGGYPQAFPQGGYHAYATLNDHAMLRCCEDMVRAWRRTGEIKFLDSFLRCADWLVSVQRPGEGWGAQYDGDRVAGARLFEPPALGPDVTVDAMLILAEAWRITGEEGYREAVRQAAGWLERVQLEPGLWARFYHAEDPPNYRPWYCDIDGNEVAKASLAKPGYVWERNWGAAGLALAADLEATPWVELAPPPRRGDPDYAVEWMSGQADAEQIAAILASQREEGYWFSRQRRYRDRIVVREMVLHMMRLARAVVHGTEAGGGEQ